MVGQSQFRFLGPITMGSVSSRAAAVRTGKVNRMTARDQMNIEVREGFHPMKSSMKTVQE